MFLIVVFSVIFLLEVVERIRERAIGFLFRNNVASGTPRSFAVSVDELEKITGLDFFPSLPDNLEQVVESNSDFSKWNFKALEQ